MTRCYERCVPKDSTAGCPIHSHPFSEWVGNLEPGPACIPAID